MCGVVGTHSESILCLCLCLRVPRVATNPKLEETSVRLPVPDALLDDILETGHLLGVARRRQEHELGIKSNVTTLRQIDARTTPVLSKASRTLPLNAEQTQHIEDRSHTSQIAGGEWKVVVASEGNLLDASELSRAASTVWDCGRDCQPKLQHRPSVDTDVDIHESQREAETLSR